MLLSVRPSPMTDAMRPERHDTARPRSRAGFARRGKDASDVSGSPQPRGRSLAVAVGRSFPGQGFSFSGPTGLARFSSAALGIAVTAFGLTSAGLPSALGQAVPVQREVKAADGQGRAGPATSLQAIRDAFRDDDSEPGPVADEGRRSDAADRAETPEEIARRAAVLVGQLGAPQFAVRERAAGQLRALGPATIPVLRERIRETADPEIRLRASELADQMVRSDREEQIASFLQGEDVGFEGWNRFRVIFGDSPPVRELFVELQDAHPDVASALAAASRQRTRALETAMVKVQNGLFIDRELPTRQDMVALLLPGNDPDVAISKPVETLILQVIRFPGTRELIRDPHVGDVSRRLLAGYFERTGLTTRSDVLWFAMELEVSDSLPLAVRTLAEADQLEDSQKPPVLIRALQTIAQFGSKQELAVIRPWFDDDSVLTERGLIPEEPTVVTVADAAMAAATVLLQVPMTEVGFPNAAAHSRFGFLPEDIAMRPEDAERRAAIRQAIQRRIDE